MDAYIRSYGYDIAVARVGHNIEVLNGQVQIAHHEATDGQPVGDDQHPRLSYAMYGAF